MGSPHYRLKMTTEDLAALFEVTSETVRFWIWKKKLVLTGDPVGDFQIITAKLAEKKSRIRKVTQPPDSP